MRHEATPCYRVLTAFVNELEDWVDPKTIVIRGSDRGSYSMEFTTTIRGITFTAHITNETIRELCDDTEDLLHQPAELHEDLVHSVMALLEETRLLAERSGEPEVTY